MLKRLGSLHVRVALRLLVTIALGEAIAAGLLAFGGKRKVDSIVLLGAVVAIATGFEGARRAFRTPYSDFKFAFVPKEGGGPFRVPVSASVLATALWGGATALLYLPLFVAAMFAVLLIAHVVNLVVGVWSLSQGLPAPQFLEQPWMETATGWASGILAALAGGIVAVEVLLRGKSDGRLARLSFAESGSRLELANPTLRLLDPPPVNVWAKVSKVIADFFWKRDEERADDSSSKFYEEWVREERARRAREEEEAARRRRDEEQREQKTDEGTSSSSPEADQAAKELAWAYRLFELKPGCGLNDVNRVFHKLAKVYHPDKNRGHERWAAERMRELNGARELLEVAEA